MARSKKKNIQENLPVDKMDQFIKKNYKLILGVAAALIVGFVAGYAILAATQNSRQGQIESIANAEMSGLSTQQQVSDYLNLADDYKFASNYIHYRAALSYLNMDAKDAAIEELAKVGGDFAVYAQSLTYDLAETHGEVSNSFLSGNAFAPLWYYRAILSAPEDQRANLISLFRTEHSASNLLAQLDRWNIK